MLFLPDHFHFVCEDSRRLIWASNSEEEQDRMAKSLCYGNLSNPLQSSCRTTDCLSPIFCYNSLHVGFGSSPPNPCQTISLSGQFMSSVISRHPWLSNSSSKKAGESRLAGKGVVNAKLVRFSGTKQVAIPFQEKSLPPSDYLKETERIVNVTFPDSARIKYIGDDVWQARLQSITFFNFSATPYCDVRSVCPFSLYLSSLVMWRTFVVREEVSVSLLSTEGFFLLLSPLKSTSYYINLSWSPIVWFWRITNLYVSS